MATTPSKEPPPSLDAAFAQVVAALGAVVSSEVSTLVKTYRRAIAAALLGLIAVHFGIILIALGVRDTLLAVIPNHAGFAITAVGFAVPILSAGLLLIFSRPKKQCAHQGRAKFNKPSIIS